MLSQAISIPAVAGLIGANSLKHLINKTARGVEAAVLADRFAGGCTYGYKLVIRLDDRGDVSRNLIAADEQQAAIITRIFAKFAAERSLIQIAKGLNIGSVPGPRGGQ